MKKWNIEPFVALAPHLSGAAFDNVARRAFDENRWFTPENIRSAAGAICSRMLDGGNLNRWLSAYEKPADFRPRRVGIVMAGNIPMVGFADLLAVLVSGHSATVKLSSKDRVLMGYIVECLAALGCDVETAQSIDRYDVDAVIATGSNSSRNRFAELFAGLPSLLRGDRFSAAVLRGDQTPKQLEGLWDDMFRYGGLGCRSVSRLYFPRGYDIGKFAGVMKSFADKSDSKEFADCYRYAKTIRTMNGEEFMDGGYFLMVPANGDIQPGIAEVEYICYENDRQLNHMLAEDFSSFQCVVANPAVDIDFAGIVGFGQSQNPALDDYADGVDTMRFLLGL